MSCLFVPLTKILCYFRSSVGDHPPEGGPLSPSSVYSEGSSLGVKEEGEERTISPHVMANSDSVLDDTPKMLEIHWMLSSMEGALRDSVISPSSISSGEKPDSSSAQSGSVSTLVVSLSQFWTVPTVNYA